MNKTDTSPWPQRLVLLGILLAVGYMILLPMAEIWLKSSEPQPGIRELEDLTLAEQIRLRVTEGVTALGVFAIGASIGSFLNVVVYRLPRRKSLLLERSRCPDCNYAIEGRYNLPIIGWLRLKGRCRNCQSPISARYPIIETVTACLFLLLYFVQLLSGGENLPVRPPNLYRGVVWVIFYTKWDLVRIYLYHCFLFSTLLAWALIHYDGQRIPLRSSLTALLIALAFPLVWPDLQLVPAQFPFVAGNAPAWLSSLASSLLGILAGGLLGWGWAQGFQAGCPRSQRPQPNSCSPTPGELAAANSAEKESTAVEPTSKKSTQVDSSHTIATASGTVVAKPVSEVTAPLMLIGCVLGWQAVLGTALLALGACLLVLVCPPVRLRFSHWPAAGGVLLAALLQHLLWRSLTEQAGPWWPSVQTTWGQAGLILLAILLLGLCVLRLISALRPAVPTATADAP